MCAVNLLTSATADRMVGGWVADRVGGWRWLGGASGCRASAAARVPNDARVPGSRVVKWRARARVHALRASDLGHTLANDLT